MLHEQLLYQWISVQHFQILLAIIQKLQYFMQGHIYLMYLPAVMLRCQRRVGEYKIYAIDIIGV